MAKRNKRPLEILHSKEVLVWFSLKSEPQQEAFLKAIKPLEGLIVNSIITPLYIREQERFEGA